MKEVEITSIECDSRVADRVTFDKGDVVQLQEKPALGAFLWGDGDSIAGKLHSDGTTFVCSEGIRTVTITVEEV